VCFLHTSCHAVKHPSDAITPGPLTHNIGQAPHSCTPMRAHEMHTHTAALKSHNQHGAPGHSVRGGGLAWGPHTQVCNPQPTHSLCISSAQAQHSLKGFNSPIHHTLVSTQPAVCVALC
jgi:hypothetical protein